ncbi:polyphenol oxidase family protein [bacterium]|nr:polyphenol oxidase family protein [bacterium]
MSFARGGKAEVIENRRGFFRRYDLELDNLAAAGLAHGNRIEEVSDEYRGCGAFGLEDAIPDVDGLVSDRPGLILAVTTADCLPVFAYDNNLTTAGIAHAGWKGAAAGIQSRLIESMMKFSGSKARDIHVHIGAGIKPCCYDVDNSRIEMFPPAHLDSIFIHRNGKLYLDLCSAVSLSLIEKGLPQSNITISGECSFCGGKYPSFRRMGAEFITDIAFITIQDNY